MGQVEDAILKSGLKFSQKKEINAWAFKNSFGKIRLDTRWEFHYCVEHLRKGERLVKVIVWEV